MAYQVFRDGQLVEINGHTDVPTLDDAKIRVPFHLGMMIGEDIRNGRTSFPGYPFADNIHQWPFEETELGLQIKVWDILYEIRRV